MVHLPCHVPDFRAFLAWALDQITPYRVWQNGSLSSWKLGKIPLITGGFVSSSTPTEAKVVCQFEKGPFQSEALVVIGKSGHFDGDPALPGLTFVRNPAP